MADSRRRPVPAAAARGVSEPARVSLRRAGRACRSPGAARPHRAREGQSVPHGAGRRPAGVHSSAESDRAGVRRAGFRSLLPERPAALSPRRDGTHAVVGSMAFGALIIGDEIMLGKRQDKHFAKLVELLRARGLRLARCTYVGDDRARLTAMLRDSFASGDIVFSFGGIGVTPDDHTRQAAAAAAGVGLRLHADAEREIRARFGEETTPQRLLLGEFPEGSRIIPNPYNRIPGFSLGDHHFVPGFPQMAWPMVEWVLDTQYRALFHGAPWAEEAIIVWEGSEGALLDLMHDIAARYPRASLFSLPSFGDSRRRRHIELGMRGDPDEVARAMEQIRAELRRRGLTWDEGR